MVTKLAEGVHLHSDKAPKAVVDVLTEPAIKFLAALHRSFEPTRQNLLLARIVAQRKFDAGEPLDFDPATKSVREEPSWTCAGPGPGLEDRRVEITGPTDRKMVINALNSGAKTFMADFEDSSSPTWSNMINGQLNLRDAINRQIDFESNGKQYKLAKNPAVLLVRPRGWHLDETRFTVDGQPMSGSLFDFGLYFITNAKQLVANGHGPYFYLPKMEHYKEARLWNDVFNWSQSWIGMPRGVIRATVLIETLPAAFYMEEILFELRDHSAGLNCGRWDYIFSFIKKRRADASAVLPDRADVTMTVPFMDAYVKLLIKTCHRRKVAAMGGMSATIPVKNDPKANEIAMAKVVADKFREVSYGHDGTWIAHPLIQPIAVAVFDKHMLGPNQYHKLRETDGFIGQKALLDNVYPVSASGSQPGVTLRGIKENIECCLAYCGAWVGGNGCIPLNWLMEDAATAEITRCQLWQWVKYGSRVKETGELITADFLGALIDQLAPGVPKIAPAASLDDVKLCARYLKTQVRAEWPSEFLTSDLMGVISVRDGVNQDFVPNAKL